MDKITVEQFKATLPAFTDAVDTDVQRWIDNADGRLFDRDFWGTEYTWAISNVVAHYLVIEEKRKKRNGMATGDITDKQVGSVRIVRAQELVAKQFDDPFMETPYGREYIASKKRRRLGALSTGSLTGSVTG